MQFDPATSQYRLSPTDLSSFLSCKHRTALEMGVAADKFKRPAIDNSKLEALFKRGRDHEDGYVQNLRVRRKGVVAEFDADTPSAELLRKTLDAMRSGADVIVQGALGNSRWYGRTDVLLRVEKPSGGPDGRAALCAAWSYEVVDTKLSLETKAGTILQLALYSMLLEEVQGLRPEYFFVVTPNGETRYRCDDCAAYFRLIKGHLDQFSKGDDAPLAAEHYPEPVDHYDICPWWSQCRDRRVADDHLSLVAGISRGQRRELAANGVTTLAALATMPIDPLPFEPERGSSQTLVRVREQARVQLQRRIEKRPIFELLPVVQPTPEQPVQGLCRLPEPSPGDIFLDLEGDPFAGPISGPPELRGCEYLFGVVTIGAKGESVYQSLWATTPVEEKAAFEAVMDLIVAARAENPSAHVYHYAPYEPSAFKRLAGRHVTRGQELDGLLRSGAFVDLYGVVRQSLRAGVERYSIKNLEEFYRYTRDVVLKDARINLKLMELALANNDVAGLPKGVLDAVESYNRDDCVSTLLLRNWLEQLRAECGEAIPRPEVKSGAPSEGLSEWQQKVHALRGQLLGAEGEDRRLLAFLLDYHNREEKAGWWEYYRLLEMPAEELLNEPNAISGLSFVEDVRAEKQSRVHRYRYPHQEMELRPGKKLTLQDTSAWGEILDIDRNALTIDVKVGPKKKGLRPVAAFNHDHVSSKVIESSIFAVGEGVVAGAADPLVMKLLRRIPPSTHEVNRLDVDVLPIQGPPGSGKTYTGGQMICALVNAGKKVGIAATGHKVIHNLLTSVVLESAKDRTEGTKAVKLAHRWDSKENDDESASGADGIALIDSNEKALAQLSSGDANVLGGTAWLWSRPEFTKQVDVLFVDEAGQVSLANAVAMCQAAKSMVLLGDPQQLDQPKKGIHPEGTDVSVLSHILNGALTMPAGQGMFLAETWRFGDAICKFTSPAFYEAKLVPTRKKDLERQALVGGPIADAGVFVLLVEHDGNTNGSHQEVDAVKTLVEKLTALGSMWIDDEGITKQMTKDDLLVVSPFNVQVSRLAEALPGVKCGTVDKFQGQQAPVSIYSMATSRPEDAPRGMQFLYDLHRLNVATSRAKCATVVVASPRLFEPECRTPEQIKLANALCWFRELATPL